MSANNKGSGKTELMRRLAGAFADCLCFSYVLTDSLQKQIVNKPIDSNYSSFTFLMTH